MMKYTKPELYICTINSADVITASDMAGKLASYDPNNEDALNWSLNS